jgi:isoleucyl-tRNA synthetase
MAEIEKSGAAKREEETLAFWKERDIFNRSLAKESPKGEFIFYEGPPTANGRPGIHHLESRAFKDAIPRYQTMQGFHVRRKAGWDTHGLPVELEVEKEIGSKHKKDIEAYGIAKFNAKCRESVLRYVSEWREFTDRIGFWVDHDDTYYTFDNSYIESVWNVIKTAHERDLLYKDYKVVPWCPRCGTALSSHEVAQGYADVKDPSVYVKFKALHLDEYFLAWTTTPWTLPGNVGLAVGENVTYVKARTEHGDVWLAKTRLEAVAPGAEILEEKQGSELVGRAYEPLYPFLGAANLPKSEREKMPNAYQIYAADFVSTEDGTGIVHTAVMYGADDFELGTKVGLPKYHLVREDGTFSDEVGLFAGKFVKDADTDVIDDLKRRGILLRKEMVEHTYPFCWRCKTPLLYYARDSWYIRMSSIKDVLIAENETINWEPRHIRDGRFGEWLKDLKDWAISRSRYWGTPLPVWECNKCKERVVIGSIEELRAHAQQKLADDLDLHRPYIDDVTFACTAEGGGCGGIMRRYTDVMDVWLDSGAMPFAQDHYPFENRQWIEGAGYPADFICEAIDQTRGWFYTLHAVGNIMGRGKAYANVICLGHVLDSKGKKMSKSIGNVVDPWTMIEKHGVDALRYFMYTVNAPGESKNFDERMVDEIVKKNIGRLGNVLSFYQLHASGEIKRNDESGHVLDRWILARLGELLHEATEGYETYRLDIATRPVAGFIDDLSVWYIRRSRDRFKAAGPATPSASLRGPAASSAVQSSTSSDAASPRLASGAADPAATKDAQAALATLRHVLYTLACIMAPAMPFFSEHLFQAVREEGDAESVHLASWPIAPKAGILAKLFGGHSDADVLASMREARAIVSEALEARDKAGIKVRQPLSRLTVPATAKLGREYLDIVAEEVNVKRVEKSGETLQLDTTMTEELREEGVVRDTLRLIQDARKAAKMRPGEHGAVSIAVPEENRSIVERNREALAKQTNTEVTIV